MNLQRFEQLIDAYGSDPQRWPPAERSAALKLLAQSPEAADLQQQSVWLDQALDQFASASVRATACPTVAEPAARAAQKYR